jgi:hypothetical protein
MKDVQHTAIALRDLAVLIDRAQARAAVGASQR